MADRVRAYDLRVEKVPDPKARISWHLAFAMMDFFREEPKDFLKEWRGMSYVDKCDWRAMLIDRGYNVLPIPDEQLPAIEGECTRIADHKSLPTPYKGPLLMLPTTYSNKVGPNYQADDEPEEPRIVVDTGYRVGDEHPAAAAV